MMTANAPQTAQTEQAKGAAVARIGADDFDRDVWCLLGLPIDVADVASASIAVEAAVRDRRRLSFVTPNVNWLVRAARDAKARSRIIDADLSLIDGAPLVLLARLLGLPQRTRTAGADVFEALRRRPGFRGRRIRVFFFGGRDGSAQKAFEQIEGERSGLEAAGWLDPGHGDVSSMSGDDVIAAVNAAEPDFIVVALGAAKGQEWIDRNKDRLSAPVIAHLGAVIDFTSGAIKRAPRWMAALGLEWLFRIAADPALAGRYAGDGLALIRLAAARLPAQLAALPKGRMRLAETWIEHGAERTVVCIAGDACAGRLLGVRDAFRTAAAAGRTTVLDLSEARRIDLAFLGLVLMLEKHLARKNAGIELAGCGKSVARLFRANAMPYLTTDLKPASGGRRAAAV